MNRKLPNRNATSGHKTRVQKHHFAQSREIERNGGENWIVTCADGNEPLVVFVPKGEKYPRPFCRRAAEKAGRLFDDCEPAYDYYRNPRKPRIEDLENEEEQLRSMGVDVRLGNRDRDAVFYGRGTMGEELDDVERRASSVACFDRMAQECWDAYASAVRIDL